MREIQFKSRKSGTLLRGRFIETSTQIAKKPLVIMLTGDGPKGSKSLSWVNMPPILEKIGISSFLFDFEGLGYSEGNRRTLSLSVAIDNFSSAFDVVKKEKWVDKRRIGAFASSFGATVLLLVPKVANQLKAIGLKSPATFIADAYYKEIGSKLFDRWRKEGYIDDNGYDFNIFLDALRYNPYKKAMSIRTPCLITQGDSDEIIDLQHSIYLYECLNSVNKRIEIFKGASHGYSEGNSWDRMAAMFVDWFSENL